MSTAPDLRAAARDAVERSCREQGIPVGVADPALVARLAAAIGNAPRKAKPRRLAAA